MNLLLALSLVMAQIGTAEEAIAGVATFYDAPTRFDAAAGPALRKALGPDWRGQAVTVSAGGKSVLVRLTDFCLCGDRNGKPTLVDLDRRTFARLAPLSVGVLDVVISWELIPVTPPTDTSDTAWVEGSGSRLTWLVLLAVVLVPGMALLIGRKRRL